MAFGGPPRLTVAEMFRGGLNVVAMPLLSGEAPDEIQENAQFYGFSDYGRGEGRYFEFSGELHEALPSRQDRIVVFVPRDEACRIELRHGAEEARQIPRSAEAWRAMVARSSDPDWILEVWPSEIAGDRGLTIATLRRGRAQA